MEAIPKRFSDMAVYGLIGEKLGHSYSKLIHERLGQYHYDLFSLSRKEFVDFVSSRQFSGLNITIPYKKAVIPLCDRISDLAREIGAVNTLYFKEDALCGTNTDYYGLLYAAHAAGISFKNKKVLILGNGGTSFTARKAAKDEGAGEILITSRRGEKGCLSYDALSDHRDVEIIVNTTPVGMYPNNGECLIDLSQFPACCGVVDVIYNPVKTVLLQQAEARSIPHSNGLPMLVAQATAAAEHFLGSGNFQEKNEDIIQFLQREIENLILLGSSTAQAKKEAEKRGKKMVSLTDPSVAADLGKEKGLLIHVPDEISCSNELLNILTQNGRILSLQP